MTSSVKDTDPRFQSEEENVSLPRSFTSHGVGTLGRSEELLT